MSRGYYDAEQQVSDLAEHLATNWEIQTVQIIYGIQYEISLLIKLSKLYTVGCYGNPSTVLLFLLPQAYRSWDCSSVRRYILSDTLQFPQLIWKKISQWKKNGQMCGRRSSWSQVWMSGFYLPELGRKSTLLDAKCNILPTEVHWKEKTKQSKEAHTHKKKKKKKKKEQFLFTELWFLGEIFEVIIHM